MVEWGYEGDYFEEEINSIPDRDDIIVFDDPKPPVGYYHYSNKDCQGALICETKNFPRWVEKEKFEVHSAYQDRLREWDRKHFEKAHEGMKGSWESKLPSFSSEKLKKFAKVLLKLDKLPTYVRFVYYYNQSSGYSCPMVLAIYKIGNKKKRKIDWEE